MTGICIIETVLLPPTPGTIWRHVQRRIDGKPVDSNDRRIAAFWPLKWSYTAWQLGEPDIFS